MPMSAVEQSTEAIPFYFGTSSPFRKKVAEKRGWSIAKYISPDIDEKVIRSDDPAQLCELIAHRKAEAVLSILKARGLYGFFVCFDQVVVCNGEIREKPTSLEEAYRYIKSYNSYPAETYSAVAACNTFDGRIVTGVDHAVVLFQPFSDTEICRLIKRNFTWKSAGAFVLGVEEFDNHVDSITKGTRESIIGLPLDLTQSLLEAVGYEYKLP